MPAALPVLEKLTIESKPRVSFAVLTAQFGDGYDQRAAAGINSRKENWSVVWDALTWTEYTTVKSALDTAKGVDYLTWTPFLGSSELKFICPEYSPEQKSQYGLYKISATLNQVYRIPCG